MTTSDRRAQAIEAMRRAADEQLALTLREVEQIDMGASMMGRAGSATNVLLVVAELLKGMRLAAGKAQDAAVTYLRSDAVTVGPEFAATLDRTVGALVNALERRATAMSRVPTDLTAELVKLRTDLATKRNELVELFDLATDPGGVDDDALTARQLKLAILSVYSKVAKAHRRNVLGAPLRPGTLEVELGISLTVADRSLAFRCFAELLRDGLLHSDMNDVADPEGWLSITDAGRRAMETKAFDDLDEAILGLAPALVDVRYQAWNAALSSQPAAAAQAAHSARELIRQVLEAAAPNEAVIVQSWYVRPNSPSPVTRKQRIRYALSQRALGHSDRDQEIFEKVGDLLDALYAKLSALAHRSAADASRDVRVFLVMAEQALQLVLLPAESTSR